MSIVTRLLGLIAILAALEFGYRGQLSQMAMASFLSLVLFCIEFRLWKSPVQNFTNLINPLLTLGLLIAAILQYGAMSEQATILSQQLDEAKKERIAASKAFYEAENAKKVAQDSANNAKKI